MTGGGEEGCNTQAGRVLLSGTSCNCNVLSGCKLIRNWISQEATIGETATSLMSRAGAQALCAAFVLLAIAAFTSPPASS